MPGAARFQDICSGHGCWPPRPNNQASPDTFVNGRGWHRRTDSWEIHCCPPCHGGNLKDGSPDTFVNGLEGGRCHDPVDCGSYVQECSPNVIIN